MVLLKQQPMTSWQTLVALVSECGGLRVPWWHRKTSGSRVWRFFQHVHLGLPENDGISLWTLTLNEQGWKHIHYGWRGGYPNAPQHKNPVFQKHQTFLIYTWKTKNSSSWSWLFFLRELSLLWLVQEFPKKNKRDQTIQNNLLNMNESHRHIFRSLQLLLNTWKFRNIGSKKKH